MMGNCQQSNAGSVCPVMDCGVRLYLLQWQETISRHTHTHTFTKICSGAGKRAGKIALYQTPLLLFCTDKWSLSGTFIYK